jgi:hypothetical protein
MGIKFHCPNGHRLNVKAFLAGKKAVCPKCGQKVVVPFESEPTAASKTGSGDGHKGAGAGGSCPTEDTATVPKGAPLHTSAKAQPADEKDKNAHQAIADPHAEPLPQTSTSQADPLAEAPSAVWYVRPPSGGQFGPAAPDVMRSWLNEGRITPDSLVWRAGWAEWQSAASTFPKLAEVTAPLVPQAPSAVAIVQPVSGVPASAASVTTAAPVTAVPIVTPVGTARPVGQVASAPVVDEALESIYDDAFARARRRRKKGADSTMIVSGILTLLVVVLFIILGIVVSRQNLNGDASPSKTRHRPRPAATSLEKSEPAAEPDSPVEGPLESDPSAPREEAIKEPRAD